MSDSCFQTMSKETQPASPALAHLPKARRHFAFLFEGLFSPGINFCDLVRLGLLVCLAVSLFGVEVFISRSEGTFIGKRIGNLGAVLYYFNFYLWIPLTILFSCMQIRNGLQISQILKANIWSLGLAAYLVICAVFSEASTIAEHRLDHFLHKVLPVVTIGIFLSDRVSVRYVRDTFLVFAFLTVLAFTLSPSGMRTVLEGGSMGLVEGGLEVRLVLESNSITTGYTIGLYVVVAFMMLQAGVITTRIEKYATLALLGGWHFSSY